MNFLGLVNRLRQEAGIPGADLETVIGVTGQSRRLADWIARSWLDIQGMHEVWRFMHDEFTFTLTAGIGVVTPTGNAPNGAGLASFRAWDKDTFRIYRADTGVDDEGWLVHWDYHTFRDTYRFGSQTPGRPMAFTERVRDDALMFGPVPDVDYTVAGEYWKRPVTLAADADTPALADDSLHMVVVWHALIKYARFEAAAESLLQAKAEYDSLMGRLEREQLPDLCFGRPLA